MNRTVRRMGTLLATILLATAALQAHALWIEMQVTKNGVYGERRFTVNVRDVKQFKEFEITIEPVSRKLNVKHLDEAGNTIAPVSRPISPFLNAELSLITNDAWVASVPVAETREEGRVTYRFRVMPSSLAQSFIEIHEGAYQFSTGASSPFRKAMLGNQQVEQVMGGTIYRLDLRNFAPANALDLPKSKEVN